MNLLEWLGIWFGPQQLQTQPLRELLDEGRRLKFAEDYPGALAAFERARAQLAPDDMLAATAIDLHEIETQIDAGEFADAEARIDRAEASASQPAQFAYLTNARGMLAQARGDLDAARTHFEAARAQAKAAQLVTAEGRAACHLAEVVLLDGNAAYAVHLLRDNLPRLQTAGDLELNCVFVGVHGLALIETGQTDEGLDLLRNALMLSEGAGYRKYERRWSLALAEHAISQGRYYDASAHLERALRLFEPAPRTGPTFAAQYSSALLLASRAALYTEDYAAAIAYAERARGVAEGQGGALTAVQGALGIALRMAGRGAEAIPHLQSAASSGGSVEVLRNLAAAYDQTGDHAAAAETYERAIAQARAAASPLEEAQARRDYGVSLHTAGKHAEAIEQWAAALMLFEDLKIYSQMARLRTDLGNARRALGQHGRALREYEQALMLLSSLEDHDRETRGLVLANAAVAYADSGDTDSADNFFSEAIAIAERAGDQRSEAVRLSNYGWFLLTVGKPRRAIATLDRAVALCEKLNLQPQIAVACDNLGLAYDVLAEYPRALELHRRALHLIDVAAHPNWAAVFRVNTAHTLIALGDLDPAETLLDEALTYARGAPGAAETVVRALVGRALIALARGTPAAAIGPLDEAIALARQADLRRALAEALSVRSRQCAAAGEAAAAASAWEEAARLYTRLNMPQARQRPAWLQPA